VTARIERIETAGRNQRARRLFFDDGDEPRLTSSAAVKELGVEVGTAVDRETIDAALAAVEGPLARDKAHRLLAHRDRSTAELTRRLLECGYPPTTATEVVNRLVELDIVDDERFAATWTRSRTASGFGPTRIRLELREKGIADEIIADVLGDLADSSAQLDAAVTALRGQEPRDHKARARLIRRLVSRGFRSDVAAQAVGSVRQDPVGGRNLDDLPS
jgi:regulatory protein